MTKTHLNVVASWSPRNSEGLSCSRNPLRNQCTKCFSWITAWVESTRDCPRTFWFLLCVLDDVATSPEVALSIVSPVIMRWVGGFTSRVSDSSTGATLSLDWHKGCWGSFEILSYVTMSLTFEKSFVFVVMTALHSIKVHIYYQML